MNNIEIHYVPMIDVDSVNYNAEEIKNSPFAFDNFIHPKRLSEVEDKKYEFYKCPAWNSWASSSFVFYSQIDIDFYIKDNKICSDNYSIEYLSKWITPSPDWLDGPCPVVQMKQYMFFWTEEKNLWIEQTPFANSILYSNIDLIPAHFPLSVWKRPVSFGFKVPTNRPVIIKRGDPIYTIRFNTDEMSRYNLIASHPTQEILDESMDNVRHKYLNKDISSWSLIEERLESQVLEKKKSKCPFSFLWKDNADQS